MPATRIDLPGLMQQAPAWSYLLIKSLTQKQRLALFQTCMQLAKTVVELTHDTTLNLDTEVPANVLDMRRHVITRLLDVGQMFDVNLTAPGPQPFPQALSGKVKSLWLNHHEPAASSTFEWWDLKNLKKLTWYGRITEIELSEVCEALEHGRLEQLCCFHFMTDSTFSTTLCKRLALVLGRQVTDLETSNAMLLRQLSHFQQLVVVKFFTWGLKANHEDQQVVSSMCGLPKLRTFHFKYSELFCGYAAVEGSHDSSERRAVIHECASPKHLPILLAADLHKIEFRGAVPYWQGACLTELLLHHDHKIICTPDYRSEFALEFFSDEHLKLLSYLQGEPILTLRKLPDLDFLPKVWAAVPSCVTSVRIKLHHGPGWQSLWRGLPTTVTRVELCFCTFSVEELEQLVASAPRHVALLKIVVNCNDTTLRALNIGRSAPPHLSVDMTWKVLH